MWACVDLFKASCRTIEPQICKFEIRGLYIGLIHGKTRDRKSRATLILIEVGYTAEATLASKKRHYRRFWPQWHLYVT
jgi:hypothetical protein